jgi:hypothetical protein
LAGLYRHAQPSQPEQNILAIVHTIVCMYRMFTSMQCLVNSVQ